MDNTWRPFQRPKHWKNLSGKAKESEGFEKSGSRPGLAVSKAVWSSPFPSTASAAETGTSALPAQTTLKPPAAASSVNSRASVPQHRYRSLLEVADNSSANPQSKMKTPASKASLLSGHVNLTTTPSAGTPLSASKAVSIQPAKQAEIGETGNGVSHRTSWPTSPPTERKGVMTRISAVTSKVRKVVSSTPLYFGSKPRGDLKDKQPLTPQYSTDLYPKPESSMKWKIQNKSDLKASVGKCLDQVQEASYNVPSKGYNVKEGDARSKGSLSKFFRKQHANFNLHTSFRSEDLMNVPKDLKLETAREVPVPPATAPKQITIPPKAERNRRP